MKKRRIVEWIAGGLLVLVIIIFAALNSSRNNGYSKAAAVATTAQPTSSGNSTPQTTTQDNNHQMQPKSKRPSKPNANIEKAKANAEIMAEYKQLLSYPRLGHSHEVGSFNITVNSIIRSKYVGSNGIGSTANGMYWIVSVTVRNDGSSPQTVDDSMFEIVSPIMKGTTDTYSPDSAAGIYANSGTGLDFATLNPGVSQIGSLVFDMPVKFTSGQMQVFHLNVSTGPFGLGAQQNFSFIK